MSMKLIGMDELMRNIKKLGLKVEQQLTEQALKKGSVILQEEVKQEAPRGKGLRHLQDEIKISKIENGKVSIHTGKAYHAHLVEFGRSAGHGTYKDKNGVERKVTWGYTAPNPFMTRAFERKQSEITKEMAKVIKRGLGL